MTIQLTRVVSERKVFPLFQPALDCQGCLTTNTNTASIRQSNSGTAEILLVPFLHPWSDGSEGQARSLGSLIGVAVKTWFRTWTFGEAEICYMAVSLTKLIDSERKQKRRLFFND